MMLIWRGNGSMGTGGWKREHGDQSIGWEHWDCSVEHYHGDGSIMMCGRGLRHFFFISFFPASLKKSK